MTHKRCVTRSWRTILALVEPRTGPYKRPVNIHVEAASVDDMQMRMRRSCTRGATGGADAEHPASLRKSENNAAANPVFKQGAVARIPGPSPRYFEMLETGTVCVSQRKLAAANLYAPLTGTRRYNIKYESPQLYKAKRERPVPRNGG
ncbi:Uncharacterized protein DBV15_08261 [Temnothorax longispinosus]|uniref:Uncharacterized protein n=1 Tax=Temnothorax longispinosus TaxID=300112 RepID=A0A4S2KNF3_9HYME|nr:Uncharacterized protein DBV15_08261 [Temnothorax longispinosus]